MLETHALLRLHHCSAALVHTKDPVDGGEQPDCQVLDVCLLDALGQSTWHRWTSPGVNNRSVRMVSARRGRQLQPDNGMPAGQVGRGYGMECSRAKDAASRIDELC